MNKKTIVGGIIIGLLVVIVVLLGVVIWQQGMVNYNVNTSDKVVYNEKNKDVDQSENASIKFNCPDDWNYYRQDVVGIEFCYPEKKWGKPGVEYLKTVTSLKNLADSYKKQNIYYRGYLGIIFFDKGNVFKTGGPVIKIFDEKYQGEHYKNARTHKLGYRDNIAELKQSGNICDYKIEFNKKWEEKGNEREFYQDCQNGVKTSLVEQSDFFNFKNTGWRYQYLLHLFAYKKLENGYFGNMFIDYNIDNTSQLKYKLNSFQDFFGLDHSYKDEKRITLTQEEFKQKKNDFEQFVKSIKVFKPSVEDLTKYKSDIANGEKDVKLIEEYYWLLTQGKLQQAYASKSTKQSFADFEEQYKNIHFAKPYEFKKLGDGKYDFYVKYQDHNRPVEIYQTKMMVVDGKLKTIFTQKFLTEQVKYGDMKAYAANRGDKNYVILEKDGKEIVIDQGESNYDNNYANLNEVKAFQDINFSPKGNYLKYAMLGYEWGNGYVYDIKNNKQVVDSPMTVKIEFTPDEKYVYYCAGAGMGGSREGIVKSVPDFDEKFSAFGKMIDGEKYAKNNEYSGISCEYNNSNREIIFKLTDFDKKIPEKNLKYQLQ